MSRVVGGFAVVVTCVALLGSCALLPSIPAEDNQQQANAEMQRIAEAVKNHDTAELKKLFSQAARQKAIDLDRGLRYFLAVFPSGRITWRLEDGGPSSGGINEFGKQTVELYAFYKVAADGKDYDLYFADFTVNQVEDPNNVGLYALGVAPYSADPRTASGAPKPFFAWTGSHYNDNGITYGDPGVYVPQNRQ